ncbi:MAG: hypothetical protein GY795_31175 [Desulfobacterales bacterium]|nr:hypothetical protein [Desulfobacterales bacterium]
MIPEKMEACLRERLSETLQINLPLSTIIYYYLMDSEGADLVKTTLVWS